MTDPVTAHEQRKAAAQRRAESRRREAAYYKRLANTELAAARQIERTWGLDSPDDEA